MAANDKIEKVYLIRAEGAPGLIKDLREINRLWLEIAKSKAALNASKDVITDPSSLKAVNTELERLNAQEAELTVRKNARLEAARQEIASNTQLAATYDQIAAAIAGASGGGGNATGGAVDAAAEAQARLAASTQAATAALGGQTAGITEELTVTGKLANQLLLLQAERLEVNQSLRENTNAYREGLISQEQFVAQSGPLSAKQAELNRAVADTRRELTQTIVAANTAEGSMAQLGTALGILRAQYRQLSAAERESSQGMELLTNIQTMDAEIKRLDGTIGNFQRQVGNYQIAGQGLANSVQQILREAPSAAVSMNTFFLAISNNLPIFFDEIKKAQEGLKELTEVAKLAQAELAKRNAAQAAADAAAQAADDSLKGQIESILGTVTATQEQTAAIREEITTVAASGAANAEAGVAAAAHAESLALAAGASVEEAAALRAQVVAANAATLAANEATIAMQRQAAATAEATAASSAQPSVLSRVGSALFSWNSALTLAVLGLTLYGGKIIEFIGGTKEATEEQKKAEEATKRYASALVSASEAADKTASTEIARMQVLTTVAADTSAALDRRLNAVRELQKAFPAYFGSLSQEAILQGKVTDEVKLTTEALLVNGRAMAARQKFGEASTRVYELEKQEQAALLLLQQARTHEEEQRTNPVGFTRRQATAAAEEAQANYDKIYQTLVKARVEQEGFLEDSKKVVGSPSVATFPKGSLGAIKQEIADYNQQLDNLVRGTKEYNDVVAKRNELQKQINEDRLKTPTKVRVLSPVPGINEELAAQKRLNAAREELNKQRVEQDATSNEQIFQNERISLVERLDAYMQFQNDRRLQAALARDTQTADARAELVAVEKLLADGTKRTADATNSLLIRRQAANVQIKVAEEAFQASMAEIARKGVEDIKGIVDSDVSKRIGQIDAIKEQAATEAAARLSVLQESFKKGEISFKTYKDREKALATEAHIYELNLIKAYLTEQIKVIQALGGDASALQSALSKVNAAIAASQGAGFDASAKRIFDLQAFYKKLRDTAIQVADDIANAYVQNEQKKIDKDIESQKSALDKEKQARLNAATSAAEKASIEKEYDDKTAALEKERFDRQKRLALAQLGIEFALASIKAVSQALDIPGAGIIEALAAEAIVALEYAGKLAVLNAQQFAQGGDVPSGGGEFGGEPHSRGGTRFRFKGQEFEAEADELAVISKRSARRRDRLTVSGTPKQIASAINAYGGGVNFAPGGRIMGRFDYGGSLGASLPAPYFAPASSGSLDVEALAGLFRDNRDAISGVHRRIDNFRVTLDPRPLRDYNARDEKQTRLGIL